MNYWDAGNWALNVAAAPAGPKTGLGHRVLHQHVIGRSPHSTDPSWAWGESPFYPYFGDRFAWSVGKAPLTAAECGVVVARLSHLLLDRYGVDAVPSGVCAQCNYPTPSADLAAGACPDCRTADTP